MCNFWRMTLACAITVLVLYLGGVGSALADAHVYTLEEATLVDAYQSGQLLRLHILAEDDSAEAQSTKLAVRDAILAAFEAEMTGDDADTLYTRLQNNVEAMRLVAETKARDLGFEGAVTAQVGVLELPEKAYGSVVLPRGEYRALRITLGKGEGKNWWCVLYPSLCLAVADDNPWRTTPEEGTAQDALEEQHPAVVWDTERIMIQWLLWPGAR